MISDHVKKTNTTHRENTMCRFVIVCLYLYCLWRSSFLTFETDQFPVFSDVRFSYLALVQDKKITCILPANACCTVYINCPPPPPPTTTNSPCFSFLK